jgi:hypothetical protein
MNHEELDEAISSGVIKEQTPLWAAGYQLFGIHTIESTLYVIPPTEVNYTHKDTDWDTLNFTAVDNKIPETTINFHTDLGVNIFLTEEEATTFFVQACRTQLDYIRQGIKYHVDLQNTTKREIMKYS